MLSVERRNNIMKENKLKYLEGTEVKSTSDLFNRVFISGYWDKFQKNSQWVILNGKPVECKKK